MINWCQRKTIEGWGKTNRKKLTRGEECDIEREKISLIKETRKMKKEYLSSSGEGEEIRFARSGRTM